MFQKIVTAWAAAMRSGDYPKGTGLLAYDEPGQPRKYCAGGVLCDLFAQEHGQEWEPIPWQEERRRKTKITPLRLKGDGCFRAFAKAPSQVFEWSGITEEQRREIENLNDNYSWPFEKIADHVEANFVDNQEVE